jgi:signal transduction histidine kinase
MGVRAADVALTAMVICVAELFVATASGPGQRPLNAEAYVFGAVLGLPVLFRHRWPVRVLLCSSVLLIGYYLADRRNIPPAPVLGLPVFDAAVAGSLWWAIGVPAFFIAAGVLYAAETSPQAASTLADEYLPRLAGIPVFFWLLPVLIFPLMVVLGELVRGRRALAAETARRLRAADDEREAEAARRVAEERVRIARELHDTVAHSMATITVQAGSALHLLDGASVQPGHQATVRDALTAIRVTSKGALSEMRGTLGQLRQPDPDTRDPGCRGRTAGDGVEADAAGGPRYDQGGPTPGSGPGTPAGTAGLGRLPALRDAVAAAGVPVTVTVEGTQQLLPGDVDHAAYRILQESLTNVLRHASPDASAWVWIRYGTELLTLEVTNDGTAPDRPDSGAPPGPGSTPEPGHGHGLAGMTERAEALGGELTAGPRPGGGFTVTARLPLAVAPAGTAAPAGTPVAGADR